MLEAVEQMMASGRWSEAAEECRQLIAEHPTVAKLYAYLGWCEVQLGRPAAAVQPFRTAVILEPHFWHASFQLAQLLDRMGRYSEALQAARDAIREKPGQPQVLALIRGLERQVPEPITDSWQLSTKPMFYTVEFTQQEAPAAEPEEESTSDHHDLPPSKIINLFPKADPAH